MATAAPQPQKKKRGGRRTAALIVLSIIALLGGAFAFRYWLIRQPTYLRKNADAAMREKRWVPAELYLKALLQKQPDDAEAHLKMATVLSEKKAEEVKTRAYLAIDDTAIEHLNRAAELAPDDTAIQAMALKAKVEVSDYDKAVPYAKRIIELQPDNDDAKYTLTLDAFKNKDMTATRLGLADLERIEGKNLRYRTVTLKMNASELNGDKDAARLAMESAAARGGGISAVDLNQLSFDDQAALFEIMLKRIEYAVDFSDAKNRANEALSLIERHAEIDGKRTIPPRTAFRYNLARLARLSLLKFEIPQNNTEAQQELMRFTQRVTVLARRAAVTNPTRADLSLDAARLMWTQNEYRAASEVVEQGLKQADPKSAPEILADLRLAAAQTAFLQKDLPKTRGYAEALITNKQHDGWGHWLLGASALVEGEFATAQKEFTQSKERLGNDQAVHAGLAWSYLRQQKWDLAIAELEQLPATWQQVPPEPRAWSALVFPWPINKGKALALAGLKRWNEVEPLLKALDGTPDELWAVSLRVQRYLPDKPEDALKELQRGTQRFPKEPTLIAAQAAVLGKLKRDSAAQALLEKYATTYPGQLESELALIQWRLEHGQAGQALARIESLEKLMGENLQVKLAKGFALLGAGRAKEALELARVLAKDQRLVGENRQATQLASLLAAKSALQLKDMPEAARALAVGAEAADPEIQPILRGMAGLMEGKSVEAGDQFLEALGRDSLRQTGAAGMLQAIGGLAEQNDPAKAEEQINQWLTARPDEPLLIVAKAELQYRQGQFDEAMATIDGLEKKLPNSALPSYLRAQAWLARTMIPEAEAEARRALAIEPGHVQTLILLAQLALQQGKLDDAAKLAADAQAKDPNNPQVQLLRARALIQAKKNKDARAILTALLKSRPSDPDVVAMAAELDLAEKLAPAALKKAETLAIDTDDPKPIRTRTRILVQAKGINAAVTDLLLLFKNAPRPQQALAVASELLALNQFDQALTWAELALKSAPDSLKPVVHATLADIYARKARGADKEGSSKQLIAAAEHWKEVLKSSPNDLVIANNLAYVMATELNQAEQGREIMTKACEKHAVETIPVSIIDTIAVIDRKLGRNADLRALLEKRLKAQPNEPVVQYYLGLVQLDQGEQEKGRETLKAAVSNGLDADKAKAANEAMQKAGPADKGKAE